MSKKKRKKSRPKWSYASKSGRQSSDDEAMSFIKYMELAKASRKHLKATNRFNPKIDFRLSVEVEFCLGALEYIFKVTKAFIAKAQHMILRDEEGFKKEVERFCEGIAPAKPTIITKNLVGEMAQIIQRDKTLKTGGKLRV